MLQRNARKIIVKIQFIKMLDLQSWVDLGGRVTKNSCRQRGEQGKLDLSNSIPETIDAGGLEAPNE